MIQNGTSCSRTNQIDITGEWYNGSGQTLSCWQRDTNVECRMLSQQLTQTFTGTYLSPNVARGQWSRLNNFNGCQSFMDVTLTLTSPSTLQLSWVARDSNCDLAMGQSGTDPIYQRRQ